MKKKDKLDIGEMLPEYDFSKGVKGKHSQAYRKGHSVRIHRDDGSIQIHHFTLKEGAVMLDPDIRKFFLSSKAVNKALRSLVS